MGDVEALSTNERIDVRCRSLKAVYDDMHQNRNRYAHNTLSYQQNLPSMKELVKGKESGNFYEWFFILTLLDKVFMNRFEGVKEVLEKNN